MLGPSAHVDTFTRDNIPDPDDWPALTGGPEYPVWLNAGAELSDKPVAAGHGRRVALRGKTRVFTYAELADWTNRIARVLADDFGVLPGNRVLILGGNTPAMIACWIAVLKAGAVAATRPGSSMTGCRSNRPTPRPGPGRGVAGPCEDDHCALQVSTPGELHVQPAQDRNGQDPALSAARGGIGPEGQRN